MDSVEKRKIIVIISVIAFLVLGVIVVFATLPSDKEETEELSVRVQDEGEVTVDKMMAAGGDKPDDSSLQSSVVSQSMTGQPNTKEPIRGESSNNNSSENYFSSDEADVLALQQQLRNNRGASRNDGYSVPVRSGSYGRVPSAPSSSGSYLQSESPRSSHSTGTTVSAPSPVISNPTPTSAPVVQKPKGRFFSTTGKKSSTDNAIAAVVHGNQTVTNGATLKMHLDQDITVNGKIIPKNSFVYGIVTFAGERMNVQVSSIRVSNSIYPVNLEVYDRDGIKGIYVPGNVKADVKGDVLESSANEISPSGTGAIGGAVRAVVTAGKAVFSRKAKEQKATVRTNYKIYLQWGRN